MKIKRIVCWFSCGADSAVATKIVLQQVPKLYPNVPVVIVNSPIKEEHSDNDRFLKDCEVWFGQQVIKIYNPKYPAGKNSIYEVFKKGFLKGPNGALAPHNLSAFLVAHFSKKAICMYLALTWMKLTAQ